MSIRCKLYTLSYKLILRLGANSNKCATDCIFTLLTCLHIVNKQLFKYITTHKLIHISVIYYFDLGIVLNSLGKYICASKVITTMHKINFCADI